MHKQPLFPKPAISQNIYPENPVWQLHIKGVPWKKNMLLIIVMVLQRHKEKHSHVQSQQLLSWKEASRHSRIILGLVLKRDQQHVCLHTQCPEIGRQQTFLDSLHSSSVSKIQKSRAQKLQITFSGLIFSLSMSQKVYIPIKQKFPDGALFPLSGPSTVPQCVHTAKAKAVCLVSLTELSSIIWYDYFTILF